MNWGIEFYRTELGREPVTDFIQSLTSVEDQAQILRVLDLLVEYGVHLGHPYVKNITGIRKLKELRIRSQSGIYRIFYFSLYRTKIRSASCHSQKVTENPKEGFTPGSSSNERLSFKEEVTI